MEFVPAKHGIVAVFFFVVIIAVFFANENMEFVPAFFVAMNCQNFKAGKTWNFCQLF